MGLFVIPNHDAIIFNLDEIERVEKIINDNCYNYLGRLISLSLEEFCPTPCSKYTTYNNLYNINNEGREEENKSQRGVYVVQNHKGVGQNKNTQLQQDKIEIITTAIKQLMANNHKITIRKVQELSGVAKATVEKHYKAIINQISQDNNSSNQTAIPENKASEIDSKEAVLAHKKSRLEERFKTIVTSQMIVPDLINVLGSKTTNKIPISVWPELIRGVNKNGFEMFWGNLQAYKCKK